MTSYQRYIRFEKGEEEWEDLFLTFIKFVVQVKKRKFDFAHVRDILLDLLEDVFLESDGEEDIPEEIPESDDEKEKAYSLECEPKIESLSEEFKEKART